MDRGWRIESAIEELPGVVSLRDGECIVGGERRIRFTMTSYLNKEKENLDLIADLNLSIAPVFEALIPAGIDGRMSILITRYTACTGEQLRWSEDRRPDVPPERFDLFYSEVERLAELQLVHPYIRGWYHALVGSASGTVVMDDWLAARTGSTREIEDMLNSAREMIARDG